MPVTDVDQERVVTLLVHDLHATVGDKYDHLAINNATRVREFVDDPTYYIEKVVEDTQQDLHDLFIDTTWPRCPRHAHPLWLHDGSWWCEKDKARIARLGELESLIPDP